MRPFDCYNPIVMTVYYLSLIAILMFSQNPILLLLAFAGGFSYVLVRREIKGIKGHIFYFLIFVVMTLINPIFSHNGRTVMFFINDSPITLEATAYGAVNAFALVSALYLFRVFTGIMTRDKLLYVFGRFSPKLALVLSMGLRYVSLFKERARRISESQKALGLYREDDLFNKIRGDMRVFSILITWALENGIITADSMSARGYGAKKRTHYSLFKFGKADGAILALTVLCVGITAVAMSMGALDFKFYPSISMAPLTGMGLAAYIAYGILSLLPILNETEEAIKWRYLRSRI